jgi:hypothetical protein
MDYEESKKIREVFSKHALPFGLCLGSKSKYKNENFRNFFIPNAIIFEKEPYYRLLNEGKLNFNDYSKINERYVLLGDYQLWNGDLDFTKNKKNLENIAREIEKNMVITNELCERQKDIVV